VLLLLIDLNGKSGLEVKFLRVKIKGLSEMLFGEKNGYSVARKMVHASDKKFAWPLLFEFLSWGTK
jgi:hypothetical protein